MYSFREYGPYYVRNLRVAVPIMLAQVGGGLVQMADVLMVGKLGTAELAGVSFASSVFVIAFVFSTCIMQSITPLVGYKHVQGDGEAERTYFTTGAAMSGINIGVIGVVLAAVWANLGNMGQEAAVIEVAEEYFVYVSLSLAPYLVFEWMRLFLAGLGNTSAAMAITLISNVVNIILNYGLIFGEMGMPRFGAAGAGLSTLISRMIMPFMLCGVMVWNGAWRGYVRNAGRRYFSMDCLRELYAVGLPISLRCLFEVTAFSLSVVMMGWMGATVVAGAQIVMTLGHFVFMIVLGIGAATTIRVSHQYGRRDYGAVRMAAKASLHLAVLNNVALGLGMIFFRHEIVGLFSDDGAVRELAAYLVIFAGIYQLSDGLQCVGVGILNGLADVRFSMVCAFVCYILVCLPSGYLLCFVCGMGPGGVWIGLTMGLTLAAGLFLWRFGKLAEKWGK